MTIPNVWPAWSWAASEAEPSLSASWVSIQALITVAPTAPIASIATERRRSGAKINHSRDRDHPGCVGRTRIRQHDDAQQQTQRRCRQAGEQPSPIAASARPQACGQADSAAQPDRIPVSERGLQAADRVGGASVDGNTLTSNDHPHSTVIAIANPPSNAGQRFGATHARRGGGGERRQEGDRLAGCQPRAIGGV